MDVIRATGRSRVARQIQFVERTPWPTVSDICCDVGRSWFAVEGTANAHNVLLEKSHLPCRGLTVHFRSTFLAVILFQALHSAEEYVFRLYEVFPPARFVSSLFSSDIRLGFILFNLGLIAFGVWCYVQPVRQKWPVAVPLAWLWVGVELLNGIGHPAWSIAQRRYTPGVVTAIVLLPLATRLAWQLRNREIGRR